MKKRKHIILYLFSAFILIVILVLFLYTKKTNFFKKSYFSNYIPADYVTCKRVIDGDTIVLEDDRHVRLIGINSPESNERHYLTAFFDLKFKVKGKVLRLEYDPINEEKNHLGKYGRLLAYVYYNGSLINEEIIRDGCAKVYLKYPFDKEKQLLFQKAEKYARDNKLGIWSPIAQYDFEDDTLPIKKVSKIDILKAQAQQGVAESQYKLGEAYINGDELPVDYEKAVEWYKKAAEQKYVNAQFKLALCYFNGKGTVSDLEQAAFWFQQADRFGGIDKHLDLGNIYFVLGNSYYYGKGVTKNYEKAFYWYGEAERNYNTKAQYCLGDCYYYGNGIAQNYKKAFDYYYKLAREDNIDAQYSLGYCYQHGQGIKPDLNEGFYWYRKAFQEGSISAATEMGNCYKNGFGVWKDNQKASHYYELAKVFRKAQNNDAQAQFTLGKYYYLGLNELRKDFKKGIYWWRKSAHLRNYKAQYNLSFCYYEGNGLSKDYKEAFYWCHKAANSGYRNAQSQLGLMYALGEGVDKDMTLAAFWWEKAAYNGFAKAQYNLARCYELGDGKYKNLSQAALWYFRAADNSYEEAFFKIADCYYYGKGINKDINKARYWFYKAAELGNARSQIILGDYYYYGTGIKKNIKNALYWYLKALDGYYYEAKEKIDNCYNINSKHFQNSACMWLYYIKLAKKGNSRAQCIIADCYRHGIGVKKNLNKAYYWYTKASMKYETQAIRILKEKNIKL